MTDNPHYMTPEEAKKMGCCMSMNRPEFAAACIGETCMAWRWKQQMDLAGKVIRKISTTHGYCGMVRT
jgi:ribosomal protein L35AE/L33A